MQFKYLFISLTLNIFKIEIPFALNNYKSLDINEDIENSKIFRDNRPFIIKSMVALADKTAHLKFLINSKY